MNQTLKQHMFQGLKIVALAVILAVGTQYVSAVTWTGPTVAPPNGNTGAPLNVTNAGQIKDGGITLGNTFVPNAGGLALFVKAGNIRFLPNGVAPTVGQALVATNADGTLGWGSAGGGGGSLSSGLFSTRSAVSQNDKIQWCPSTHPLLVTCSTVAATAPSSIDDLGAECPTSGACDMQSARGNDLGGNDIYFETVVKNSGSGFVYGCVAYDKDHQHRPYRIDITCAN